MYSNIPATTAPTGMAEFGEFLGACESFSAAKNNHSKMTQLSVAERTLIGRTWGLVCEFINKNNLAGGGETIPSDLSSGASFANTTQACEQFNANVPLNQLNISVLEQLCVDSGIPTKLHATAMRAVGQMIFRMMGGRAVAHASHFTTSNTLPSAVGTEALLDLHKVLPASLHAEFLSPAMESFGTDTDRVLPDIRIAMTVTLLKFHRGLLNRVMHRRTSPQTVVNYVIPWAEVYDLNASMSPRSETRQSQEHRKPFISLYGDPSIVSNTLRRIEPLKDNDDKDVLVADNIIRIGRTANIMDLSRLANTYGFTQTDYTDLIADGPVLEKVLVRFSRDGVTEDIEFYTAPYNSARLVMGQNVKDSGDRRANFMQIFPLTKELKTASGAASQIFSTLTARECLTARIDVAASLSLKWADAHGIGSINGTPYHPDQPVVPVKITTVATGLTMEVIGYVLDAKFSEENLRKTNIAVRSHYRTMTWEIPVGRNYVVDYALQQALPEFVMSNVTEAISLGQDDRALKIITRTLKDVYDRIQAENPNPEFREFQDRIGFEFVASQLVNPWVIVSAIDCARVDTIRSSDILGDIRQYVELQLINIMSLIHQNSYYKTQLNSGEKPVYKLITSSIILENLFNIPHIHNHMEQSTNMAFDGDTVEYKRVLPNGVILECVSCTYNEMRDKIVIIPFREGDPESILNFGHNWDYGTYLAHYNPQVAGGVNKRVFANAREMPLVTNPCGVFLTVNNISELIDMYQKISLVPAATPLVVPTNP